MAKIIAITNQKGGVGKTTTAVNVAGCLAALEKKVLLIDVDPQGNASQALGFTEVQDEDIYEAMDAAGNPDEFDQDLLKRILLSTDIPYLHIIPSSNSLAGMELELVNAPNRNTRLKYIVDQVKADYDYIFIDAPPSLGLLTINILCAARHVVIPVQSEYFALQGLAELFNTIRMVQKNLNNNLDIAGALITMHDQRLQLHRQVVEEIRSTFSDKVFKITIPRNIKLGEAPSHGKPIILYDILCPGAKSYMALAQEILALELADG
jgi:chromosome partitioning protein